MNDKIFHRLVCAVFGHSRIQTTFFGYFYCGRCGDQVGDSLGSCYKADKIVIVGHNCEKCRDNYKKLKWHEKLFVKKPFGKAR